MNSIRAWSIIPPTCNRLLVLACLSLLIVGGTDLNALTLTQPPARLPQCPNSQHGFNSLVVSPFYGEDHTMIISDSYTLWRSMDGAASWRAIYEVPTNTMTVLSGYMIAPVAAQEQLDVYLMQRNPRVDYNYIAHSDDGGDTWGDWWYSDPLRCSLSVTNQESTLFASCNTMPQNPPEPDGVHRSDDHGQSWQHVWDETGTSRLVPSPDYTHDLTVFVMKTVTPPIPMVSTDGGVQWQDLSPGLCPIESDDNLRELTISPNFATDRVLFGRTGAEHVLQSRDGGSSWQHLFPNEVPPCEQSWEFIEEIAPSPDYDIDQTVFMLTTTGLHVSYDAGVHWRELLGSNEVTDIIVRQRPKAFFHTTYFPLLLSGDVTSGTDINRLYLPLIIGSGTFPQPIELILFARQPGEHVYYQSDDGGITWQCLNLPPTEP